MHSTHTHTPNVKWFLKVKFSAAHQMRATVNISSAQPSHNGLSEPTRKHQPSLFMGSSSLFLEHRFSLSMCACVCVCAHARIELHSNFWMSMWSSWRCICRAASHCIENKAVAHERCRSFYFQSILTTFFSQSASAPSECAAYIWNRLPSHVGPSDIF